MFAGQPFAGGVFAGILLVGEPLPPPVVVARPGEVTLSVRTADVALDLTTGDAQVEAAGLRIRVSAGMKDDAR